MRNRKSPSGETLNRRKRRERREGRFRCGGPSWLVIFQEPVNDSDMSKVEQMESELRKLSQAELRQIREWLDDVLEDELEFTPEFESAIRQSERDMAEGKPTRIRESDGG